MFWPIVLLNMLGKLIEKVIAKRIQFTVINNNFIHPSQLGGLKFKSTMDVGVTLTYIVRSRWAKGKTTSTLAFNISQFFPSLNHHLLMSILNKIGLELKVATFFVNYLVQRKTNYVWNNLQSPEFEVNIGVGQGSAPFYCDNHLSQKQVITQAVNLLKWISSGEFTRELL